MKWLLKKYKLTLATLTLLAGLFTWASQTGILVSPSMAQIKILEAKMTEIKKAAYKNTEEIQKIQVQQAKDVAAIRASLEAVTQELKQQRDDTRQMLNLLVQIKDNRR